MARVGVGSMFYCVGTGKIGRKVEVRGSKWGVGMSTKAQRCVTRASAIQGNAVLTPVPRCSHDHILLRVYARVKSDAARD